MIERFSDTCTRYLIANDDTNNNGLLYRYLNFECLVGSFQCFDKDNESWLNLKPPTDQWDGCSMVSANNLNCIYMNFMSHYKIFSYIKERNEWLNISQDYSFDEVLSGSSLVAYNNVVYRFGGLNISNIATNKSAMLDPRIGKWYPLPSMIKATALSAAVHVNVISCI